MLPTEFVYYGPCSYGASGYDLHMFCAIACRTRDAVKFVNLLLGWSCIGPFAVRDIYLTCLIFRVSVC